MTPSSRTPAAYETMYDEFIDFSGGRRVDASLAIPVGKKNADYWIELDEFDILLELKQLTKFDNLKTVSLRSPQPTLVRGFDDE